MRLHRLLLGAAVIAASAILNAQNQTVFRAETNYVEVDAVVTDANGQFVPGLTAADFQVSEQRQAQGIASFAYIDMPVGPNAVSTTPSPVRFRPDLPQRERVNADRIYLLYLNGNSGGAAADELQARKRAQEFVRDFLQPGDIAAVWNGWTTGRQVTFTNDTATLLRDIGPFGGAPNVPAPAPHASSQGEQLRDAINWLDGIQGRRKSLILFTAGWGIGDDMTRLDPDGRPQREREVTEWLQGRRRNLSVGATWLNPTDITERSDVHIYSYDVRGLVAPNLTVAPNMYQSSAAKMGEALEARFRTESESSNLLRSIADQTGGLAFVDSNDFRQGFARIVTDNSQYYLLGYYSPNAKRDGIFRSVSVRVTRPGLKVRARDGYVAR